MADVHTAHTAVDSATFEAAHALLDAAFDGAFSEHDWDHALGGLHALAREGSERHCCIEASADSDTGRFAVGARGRSLET